MRGTLSNQYSTYSATFSLASLAAFLYLVFRPLHWKIPTSNRLCVQYTPHKTLIEHIFSSSTADYNIDGKGNITIKKVPNFHNKTTNEKAEKQERAKMKRNECQTLTFHHCNYNSSLALSFFTVCTSSSSSSKSSKSSSPSSSGAAFPNSPPDSRNLLIPSNVLSPLYSTTVLSPFL